MDLLNRMDLENRYGFTLHDMKTFQMLKRQRLLWFLSEIQITYFKQFLVYK